MDEELLIELVRKAECLYNLQHADYDNVKAKDNVWKEIGTTLKCPAEECKKTWSTLRAYYRRALSRKKSVKSGQAAKKQRTWRFESQMEFLNPFMKERETKGNLANLKEKETTENMDSSDENFEPDLNTEHSLEQSPSTPCSSVSAATQGTTSRRNIKRPSSDLTSALTKFITSIQDVPVESDFKRKMMIFFSDIAETMSTFTVLEVAEIKKKIFDIVTEKQLEKLRQQQAQSVSNEAGPSSGLVYELGSALPEPQNYYGIHYPYQPTFQSLNPNNPK